MIRKRHSQKEITTRSKTTTQSGNFFLTAPFPDRTTDGRDTGPDSVMVRTFASEAGGAGSNPGRVIPKTLKMVPVATLLGAQHQ